MGSINKIFDEMSGETPSGQNWVEVFIRESAISGNLDSEVIAKRGDEIAIYIFNNRDRLVQQKNREYIKTIDKIYTAATATRKLDRQINLTLLLTTNPTVDEIHWILKKIATVDAPDAFANRDSITKVLMVSLRNPDKISSALAIWAFINFITKTDPLEADSVILNAIYKNHTRSLNIKELETLCLSVTTAIKTGEVVLRTILDESMEQGRIEEYTIAKNAYAKYISRMVIQPDCEIGEQKYAVFLRAEGGEVRHYIIIDENGKISTKTIPEMPFSQPLAGGKHLDMADLFLQNKGLTHKNIIELLGLRLNIEDIPSELFLSTKI